MGGMMILLMSFPLMMVYDFKIVKITVFKLKTYPPFLVDAD